jgi:hypothetical protein
MTPDDTPPVALHSNPGPEHAFVDASSGAFLGLIDFGDAYCSHPALDLRSWTEQGDAEAVFAGYNSAGTVAAGFEDVQLTGRIIVELAMASRGHRTPEELAHALDELLG